MSVLLIASGKGGVSKSVTTIGLAGVAFARNVDVMVVDADQQGASLRVLGPNLVTHAPFPSEDAVRRLDGPGRLVLVDTPPGLPKELAGALSAADAVLGVCGPTWADMSTVPALERWCDVDVWLGGRFDARRRLHKAAVEQYRARFGDRWLGEIPNRVEVEEAAAECRPFLVGSQVHEAFDGVWDRMMSVLGWEF